MLLVLFDIGHHMLLYKSAWNVLFYTTPFQPYCLPYASRYQLAKSVRKDLRTGSLVRGTSFALLLIISVA